MNLRDYRHLAKLTLKELANKAGISYSSIFRYESGERVPTLDVAAKLAAALNCSVDDLIRK